MREGPEVFHIHVDGTRVNDRETKGWMKCKVRVSFSERVLISKKRVWIMDNKSYSSVEDAEFFRGEVLYGLCKEWA